ncbi:MAG: quaternary ammonium compound efflux SMR transporter SugE [Phycisphaerae bacterium]
MAWIVLIVAGVFEVIWAVGTKYSHGLTEIVPATVTLIGMVVSMALLSVAVKTIPVGTAYAVWIGIGTVGTALMGIILFGEPATITRLGFIGLIVLCVIGLKLTGSS